MSTALELRGVTVRFGGHTALAEVDLAIEPSSRTAVVGPNGAGKTTLFDVVSGFVTPDVGRVLLRGQDITDLRAERRPALGLARSFQDARLFPSLTAGEVLRVAVAGSAEKSARTEAVAEVVELLDLHDVLDTVVAELPSGTRRAVEIAVCLVRRPTVMLLDEPSAGMSADEARALPVLLSRVADAVPAAIVIVEHDEAVVRAFARDVITLVAGRVVSSPEPRRL